MRTGRPKAELVLTEEEQRELEALAKRRRSLPAASAAGLQGPGFPRGPFCFVGYPARGVGVGVESYYLQGKASLSALRTMKLAGSFKCSG